MMDTYMNNINKLLAYHNDPKIKEDILLQLKHHYDSDEIVKGEYWENGKGCAVGCTLHSSNHKEYEIRFGIPKILAYLEDGIFEKLPNELSKEWPIRFMDAINVGADLSKVWSKFSIWMLGDPEYGVINFSKNKKVIQYIIDLYQRSLTEEVSSAEFKKASVDSYDPAYDYAAATADAYAAAAAVAVSYAPARNYSTAACDYTAAACDYTASAYAYAYTSCAATVKKHKEKHYIKQANKLIQIIKETT